MNISLHIGVGFCLNWRNTVYLGILFTSEGRMESEINRCNGVASTVLCVNLASELIYPVQDCRATGYLSGNNCTK